MNSAISSTQLRSIRKQLGMTRADLARACRVGVAAVNAWENSNGPIRTRSSSLRILHRIIRLAPHLLARRANPNWKL